MTAAELRRLRAAVLAPDLTAAQRRFRAWQLVDAASKTPRLVRWWACLCDIAARRYTPAQERELRRYVRDAQEEER